MKSTNIIHPKMESVVIQPDGSVKDIVEWETEDIDVKGFVERLASSYDLNAIFQRDAGWSFEMKAALIYSIMNGTPIGYCILCQKTGTGNFVHNKNVIDFKNRSLAIQDFWNGKFSINIRLQFDDGSYEEKRMTWPDLLNSEDPQLINCKQKFLNYKITCITYKGLNLVQQAKKFIQVNTGLLMQNEEKLYGDNFYAKGFFHAVHEFALKDLTPHINRKQERDNVKEKGTIYAHRLMFICFGATLNDAWAIRDLGNSSNKPFVRGVKEMNEALAVLIARDNYSQNQITEKFLAKTPYYGNIVLLKQCCDEIAKVLNCNNPINKKQQKNTMFDCVIFFMKKIIDEKLTTALMREFPSRYLDIITNYVKEKSKNSETTGQSVTTKKLNERQALFDKVWDDYMKDNNLDDGFKNTKPTEVEIAQAMLVSPTNCPITNNIITQDDIELDHFDCKSKNSKTTYNVVSKIGNRLKGNNSLEQNKKVVKYQELSKE